jgi:hypothetical protein
MYAVWWGWWLLTAVHACNAYIQCLHGSLQALLLLTAPPSRSPVLPACTAGEYIAVEFLEQQYSSSEQVEQASRASQPT